MSNTHRSGGRDAAATDLKLIRDDIAFLREDLAQLVKDIASGARDEVSEEARRVYATVSDRGERSMTAVLRGMEERPLLILLLAFGVGFIGGTLLRR